MELSENFKLRLDYPAGEVVSGGDTRAPSGGPSNLMSNGRADPGNAAADEADPNEEAESQMRRALGLLGETQRHRPDNERTDQSARTGDRFNGGLHRRRFVQDGDVPVTVLRRDPAHEAPAHRNVAAPQPPTSSRLQRTEAALGAETAAREKAERSLAETLGIVRDLQTKIGHAELAKNEAIAALNHEREVIAQLRADGETWQERLQETLENLRAAERTALAYQEELADERNARKGAERALHDVEIARDTAEQLVRTLSEEKQAARSTGHSVRKARTVAEPEVAATTSRRGRASEPVGAEPEPVKWWLNTKPTWKKR